VQNAPPNPSLKRSANDKPPGPRVQHAPERRAGLVACRRRPLIANVRLPSVTLRTFWKLALAAASTAASINAISTEAEPAPILKLRQGGELSCEPALPHFCENVHVRCAGQTTAATFSFKLRAVPDSKSVALVAEDEGDQRNYVGASSEWADDNSYLLLSPRSANGYVKLSSDGKYVFRHYIQARGVMSLGRCK
jgi:hypothetical protein